MTEQSRGQSKSSQRQPDAPPAPGETGQSEGKTRQIRWQASLVGRARREAVVGHRGAVLWLTGLSGAGKTTLGRALEEALVADGVSTYLLDAENVRHGLSRDLGFSPADRDEHVRRLGEVAKLFADAAVIAIVACISPYEAGRAALREAIGADFHEVHVATSLAVCEARDPRGLYRRARSGELAEFTGISAPYEPPRHPELIIDTHERPVEAGLAELLDYLATTGILPARPRSR